MKPTSVALLCLPFLLVLVHLTLAKRGSSGGGKSTTNRGTSTSTSNRGNANSGKKPTKGAQPQPGSNPKKADSNQGRPTANRHGYPQQGWGAGKPNQPQAGGYGGREYPGGQLNYNPSNRILSPGFGGSYGYGSHGGAGGSPYSRSVQGMGYSPSSSSKGFGRGAVMAAGTGVITGMALGYGLSRVPRHPIHFQSPEDERYYNQYMYQKYGQRSTDKDDYSRDYVFSPPSFSEYFKTCMKRQDLLLPTVKTPTSPIIPIATDKGPRKNTLGSNDTLGSKDTLGSSKTMGSSNTLGSNDTLGSNNTLGTNQTNNPTANPLPPASKDFSQSDDADDNDDDTVSIVEIGYPALIDQLRARRCVHLYIDLSGSFLKKRGSEPDGVAQCAGSGLQQVLAVVVGTLLSLASCN